MDAAIRCLFFLLLLFSSVYRQPERAVLVPQQIV